MMTEKVETQEKQEVRIGGDTYEVITREAAERIIRLADPRMVVACAFEAAVCPDGGAAFLDLQSGTIASHAFNDGLPPDEAAYVVLRREENPVFEGFYSDACESVDGLAGSVLDGREIDEVVGRVRARMRAEGRDEREIDEVDASGASLSQMDIDDYLMETHNQSYRDRLGLSYAYELSIAHKLPEPRHFVRFARAQLDAIYG